VWEKLAQPVFERSRVKYTVVHTEKADHAYEMVAGMKPEELLQVGARGWQSCAACAGVASAGGFFARGSRSVVSHEESA
jgi:hypothetical protein